jgi:sulfatase modifying factor 1
MASKRRLMSRCWLIAMLALPVFGCDSAQYETAANCGHDHAADPEFITIPAGQFIKGLGAQYPEKQSSRTAHVSSFKLQIHEVTNAQFESFVEATSYVSDAEESAHKGGPDSGSAVFDLAGQGDLGFSPWRLVQGATWRTPDGPGSSIEGKDNFPVVHISLNDARSYAKWVGGRLPTEDEWEHAARLGLADPNVQTSGAFDESGNLIANTWQGLFPISNTADDGFMGAAPIGCFEPSQIGLFDMIGNVWEWTDTPFTKTKYTIKGGSYLCADNYCRRYRPVARESQDIDFSTNHIGFRIAKVTNK